MPWTSLNNKYSNKFSWSKQYYLDRNRHGATKRVDFPKLIVENKLAPLHEKHNSNLSTDFQKPFFGDLWVVYNLSNLSTELWKHFWLSGWSIVIWNYTQVFIKAFWWSVSGLVFVKPVNLISTDFSFLIISERCKVCLTCTLNFEDTFDHLWVG